MITIEKISEAQLRVYSDDFGIEQELSNHFEFYMPGYRFTPQYRAKLWDGKVRLYDVYRKTLPNGLLEYVQSYARKMGYNVNLQDEIRTPYENISLKQLQRFIEALDIHTRGKPIDLRDYQVDAIYQAINREKMLALSPTSSGKSAIIYVVIRWLLTQGKRIILMVPTTTLVTQMVNDFKDYASEIEWDADEHCHKLYSGQLKDWSKPVLVTTWQSVHSMSKAKAMYDFYKSWDCIIGDEAHRFASNSIQQIGLRLTHARWRIGTTGTIQDEKVSKLTLEGTFGPVYRVITTKQLMDAGQVVNLRIKCITLDYPDTTRKLLKGADYQSEIDYIVQNAARNEFIAKLAKHTKGNTLVLFNLVDKHGKPLYDLIKRMCPDKPVYYISGETHVDKRESIRTGIEKEENATVVASYATLATGVNMPSIENIILAHPIKSKIRNLQSIGRGLRLKEGKDKCNLFDISDDFSYKSKMNHTYKHFKLRIEVYASEDFEFSMSTYKLPNG